MGTEGENGPKTGDKHQGNASAPGGQRGGSARFAGVCPQDLGVYVHFPYCLKKCPYCDFVSFATDRRTIDHEGYADAVLAELERKRDALAGRTVKSVFFGGGTPSLWEPAEIGRVLEGILAACERTDPEVEVTVECNPTSLDEGRARALREAGVNRLSVGVQSLDPGRLEFLGRLHGAADGLDAVRAALRAGIPRVSGDLIHGVAGSGAVGASVTSAADVLERPQRPVEAAEEAARLADTGVTHVSSYGLTIEPNTLFGELARRGRLPVLPDEVLAETFFAVERALESRGLVHYEISNYARPGHESRHNLGYWRGADYLGLGCAAFGTLSRPDGWAVRTRNFTDPRQYVERALSREPCEQSTEELDPEMRLRERIMLGLRIREGLDLERAAAELGVPAWTDARRRAAERLVRRSRLVIEGPVLRVPPPAWIFADGTAADLF